MVYITFKRGIINQKTANIHELYFICVFIRLQLAFTSEWKLIYNTKGYKYWRKKEGIHMSRMYKVLGFWTGIIGVMAYLGDMQDMALLFLGQTIMFVSLGYLNLSERMYIYIFGAYLTVFFVGFTYWSTFMMTPGAGGGH